MNLPFKTPRDKALAVGLIFLWALLYLPNLRTNPNWYGDEGEWMEASWQLAHGKMIIGPLINDFVYPTPYPPLYMVVNGVLLRAFGYDLVVGRALGAFVALACVAILFWIGTRLRDQNFGWLCAAAFLVYPEAVTNFRWARGHPMCGMFALASVGFLVRYVQEKRLRDVVWAGLLCSLAIGTNYYAYPLAAAVVITAAFVNRRHVLAAAATAGAFVVGFLILYLAFQPGGWSHLMEQAARANEMSKSDLSLSPLGQVVRFYRNVVTLGFLTPTIWPGNVQGIDLWLVVASLGLAFFPVARFRLWIIFWTLILTVAIFRKLDNVPLFFYPATIFLPLLAIGFAGGLVCAGEWVSRLVNRAWQNSARLLLPVSFLTVFACFAMTGSLGHYRTKIDLWTQHSVADGEAAGQFINAHTTAEDLVILPKQIYWLIKKARVAMLWQTIPYEGHTTEAYPVPIPHELFWFDCRWQNAKYVVLAYGQDANGRPYGIDAVYTMGLSGMREILQHIQAQKWPVAFQQGEYLVLANPMLIGESK